MPVSVDYGYTEKTWTGVETSFAPNMVALDAAHVAVRYRSASGVLSTLTAGVHLSVTKAGDVDVVGAISSAPIAMPTAPGTVIFQRTTPADNDADFANLEGFDPDVLTRLADAAALRDAELLGRQIRTVTPWDEATDEFVDFGDRTLQAADPVEDQDVATKIWVLTVTGILNLVEYVAQCSAYAAAALGYRNEAQAAVSGAEGARDTAELWAEAPEDIEVEPARYSALHHSAKAAAAAGTILPLLNNIDYGFVSDAPTETRDYGTVS